MQTQLNLLKFSNLLSIKFKYFNANILKFKILRCNTLDPILMREGTSSPLQNLLHLHPENLGLASACVIAWCFALPLL